MLLLFDGSQPARSLFSDGTEISETGKGLERRSAEPRRFPGFSTGQCGGNGCAGGTGMHVKAAAHSGDTFAHTGDADARELAAFAKSREDFWREALAVVGDFNGQLLIGHIEMNDCGLAG